MDIITLCNELEAHQDLERVGSVAYVSSLLAGVPDRPSIASYVQIVRAAAARRIAAKQIEAAGRAVADPSVPTSALAEVGSALTQIAEGVVQAPQFSEDALALRFSRKYADELRYVHRWGTWMRWDGMRWAEDRTLDIFDLARGVCRQASAECGDPQKFQAAKLASKATSAAVERMAASDRCHAATAEQWDGNPWLLNTPTGTIDLNTGEVQPHRRADYLTKSTAVGPGGDCVLWLQFLNRITGGDPELQAFLQRMVGYCLTGSTREQGFFFVYGTGANGKSVFLKVVSGLLGGYARTAPASVFTASTSEHHPTDLAGLRGARFVTAIETEEGARWAESKIKAFTGGDKIAARFMHGDFFEFWPEGKLVIAGNHKPGLRSVDRAMRRRLHLVPFTVTIPESERDPLLEEKLREEFPGILSWAIHGCLDWQRRRLAPPASVRDATEEYFACEDTLRGWIEERCFVEGARWASSGTLFADWAAWCQGNGENPRTQKWFAQQLEDRGFKPQRTNRARGFNGLGLQRTSVTEVTHRPI